MTTTYLFKKDAVKENVSVEEWRALPESECSLLWVDVRGYDAKDIEELAAQFDLHRIAVESCIDAYRRPHLYEFDDHFYVNMTLLRKEARASQGIKPAELHLFAGKNFIITAVREKTNEAVDRALENFRDTPGMCAHDTGYAVYLVAEYLVESYVPVVEKLDDEADKLENIMLERPDKKSLKRLFTLKSRGFELRRLMGPQRDILSEMARRKFAFLEGDSRIYYQDLYNRMIRVFDMLDTIREILSGCLDIYLSTVSNRLNEVMKILTVLATILGVSTLITGFFGMNFTELPWLGSPNAFRNTLLFMGGCSVSMLILFKWKKWL